jgi:hypothetical protein
MGRVVHPTEECPESSGSVVLALGLSPSGETAVDTAYPFAVPAGPFRCSDKNRTGFITVQAPFPAAVPAGCGFV